MMTNVIETNPKRSSTEQIWLNPVDHQVYSTVYQPDNGFHNEVGAYKIYDPVVAAHNRGVIDKASINGDLTQNLFDGIKSLYYHPELREASMHYDSLIKNNRVKEAAKLSPENKAVDVARIYTRLYDLKDRNYEVVELIECVPTEQLVLTFDKVRKQNGMEVHPENR